MQELGVDTQFFSNLAQRSRPRMLALFDVAAGRQPKTGVNMIDQQDMVAVDEHKV